MKKHISKYNDISATNFLIEEHTIGSIRGESDLINDIYHCRVTLSFIKDMLSNIDGTNEEKLEFVDKVINNMNIVINDFKQDKLRVQRLQKMKNIFKNFKDDKY